MRYVWCECVCVVCIAQTYVNCVKWRGGRDMLAETTASPPLNLLQERLQILFFARPPAAAAASSSHALHDAPHPPGYIRPAPTA